MAHLVFLFTKGFHQPLKGLVKSHKPTILKYAMNLTRELQNALPKTKYPPKPTFTSKFKDDKKPCKNDSIGRDMKGGKSKEELKRKKLCFTINQPLVPRHKCAKGKAHFIDFFLDDEEEMEEDAQQETLE